MVLALRLYGRFHWPPTPDVVPEEKRELAEGVIEIHFRSTGEEHRAFLLWIPRYLDDGRPPEEPGAHIFDLDPEDALKWFKDNKEYRAALWLDREAHGTAKNGIRVVFRGAFLLEQYSGDATPSLDVQWPLMAECQYHKKKTTGYSGLTIYHQDEPRFCLNIGLPIPVRRKAPDLSPDYLAPPAFPFAAVFSCVVKGRPFLDLLHLIGGWIGPDGIPVPRRKTKTAFAFNNIGRLNKRLGSFGFAERGDPGPDFAIFRGQADIELYWPRNAQAFQQDVLWPYGFETRDGYDDFSWLTYGRNEPADLSIRFGRIGKNNSGPSKSLIYRVRAQLSNSLIDRVRALLSGSRRESTNRPGITVARRKILLGLSREISGRLAKGVHFGPEEPEGDVRGRLLTSDSLAADCELSWEIARKDIWTLKAATDWSLKVAVRLHWQEEVSELKSGGVTGKGKDAGKGKDDFDSGLLAEAAFSFSSVREALPLGEAGQPHSFLPTLSATKKKKVRFVLFGSPLRVSVDKDRQGLISWGRAAPDSKKSLPPWSRPPMRLSLSRPQDHVSQSLEAEELVDGRAPFLELTAADLSFFQTPGVSLRLELSHDENWRPENIDTIEDGPPFFASYLLRVAEISPLQWNGRLSSLAFERNAEAPKILNVDEAPKGFIRVGGRGARLGLGNGAPGLNYPSDRDAPEGTGGRIAAEFDLSIPVTQVEPIGTDVARTDRTGRPAPLLIPISPAGQQASADKFWLRAIETLSPTHDRWLQADIYEQATDTGDRSYVVLSSEPFSVYQFRHKPLSDRGQSDSASIAYYSSDDRIWQFKRVSDYYHFVLPPQSVGESADKPRRLEIHDLDPSVPDGGEDCGEGDKPKEKEKVLTGPPRPHVPGDDTGLKRRAVEFRLTPSAEIWIRPSDVERGYFMPESAAYEIFRQHGEYGLGAALAFLRAEFLYGLSVGIDVSKERSIARGARVAEIEALTGRLAGPARDPDAERKLLNRWNAIRGAVARRPERLEIWARDLDSAIDFTPARFADGVQFALRHTALHRAPLLDLSTNEYKIATEDLVEYRSRPKIAGLLSSGEIPKELEKNPRHHPQGLSGGALWPVESLNLFRALLQAPQSAGGAIESIALTPRGGDATQKALFLGGKVTIISETREGDVQRLQVEVLGRICALWHRAKHVVVYDRTVNPSAQFAPKKEEDPDRTRSRRPILRKVSEYIELLQPERGYPDFSTAAVRSCGFLERVRFNSKIINVDSAWSSEVGDYGWQIPLWNRLSARERPQVYTMPDIAFVSTAEGEGDNPCVAQECRDPDYIFFYADFSPDTTADTDSWKPLLNLDYANMPLAAKIAKEADIKTKGTSDEARPERRRRAVSRFLPGLRRFTWRLAPAAQKTAINAGRAGKPVYVGLDSVSFMRATHTGQEDLTPKLTGALDASKSDADWAKPEERVSGYKYWTNDGESGVIEDAGEFVRLREAIVTAIKSNGDLTQPLADMSNFLTPFGAKIADIYPKDHGLGKFKDISSAIKSGQSFCARLKADAVALIQGKEMLVSFALRDWLAQVDEILEEIKPFANEATKSHAIEQLRDRAVAYIKPLFEEASKDIGELEEGIEIAQAALIDLEAGIEAVIERVRQRINQFVAGYDQSKPWSNERRTAFRAGLTACLSSVADDISAEIDETRQRLGVELNEVSQAIGGHIAKALKAIAVAEAGAINEVTTLKAATDVLYAKIDKIVQQLGGAQGRINDWILRIAQFSDNDVSPDLKAQATAALLAMQEACRIATSKIEDARKTARAADAAADEALTEIEGSIATLAAASQAIGVALGQAVTELRIAAAALSDTVAVELAGEITGILAEIDDEIKIIDNKANAWIEKIDSQIDALLVPAAEFLDRALLRVKNKLRQIPSEVLPVVDDVKQGLQDVEDALAPGKLLENVVQEQIIERALKIVLEPLPEKIDPKELEEIEKTVKTLRMQLGLLLETVSSLTRNLTVELLDKVGDVTTACNALFEGAAEVEAYLKAIADQTEAYIADKLTKEFEALKAKLVGSNIDELLATVRRFDYAVRSLQNNLSRAYDSARVYADRVLDQFSKLDDGGISAAPSNILKLYSAVTSAPEIAALKADIDRIRANFDELSDIIETTEARALFNRLGDELKALGLSLPFDKIGDRLLPAELGNFNISDVFRNFGGTKLQGLLKGYKIPSGVKDAIRVTHDFDKEQARAWVQVDIDAKMPGRRSLFSIGVFKADFLDMQLTGQVRLEASKDQDKVTQTGHGRIGTVIDLVAGGQSLVRFEKFGLNLTREGGLDIEFDPKNIRLNPSFKFIQDFLSTLFPDEVGGLEVIKQDGIPVGVQHDFAIPPISLNFGTSGVSNISIENHFKLLAYPDFMLANRFNLSTLERPFIFSIFIIGGTGYIQVDAEYRPFDNELMVVVEAGAGGSASLAFAFGPFVGQVFITLSGTLAYRKMIGKPGGGLSISVVLVIAGHVDVAGIVTVGITLILRMTYRDNGQVDGEGSLTVTIRISRFFKITARANVKYKLRGGKSETQTSTSVGTEITDEKLKKLHDAAKKLEEART